MKIWWWCVFALTFFQARADLIVLRNGKTLESKGAYQLKDGMVVFEDAHGQLIQVPAKVVDFERTEEANERAKATAKEPELGSAEDPEAQRARASEEAFFSHVEEKQPQNHTQAEKVFEKTKSNSRSTSRYWDGPKFDIMNLGDFEVLETPERYAEAKRQLNSHYRSLKSSFENAKELLARSNAELLRWENMGPDERSTYRDYEGRKASAKAAVEYAWSEVQLVEIKLKELDQVAINIGVTDYASGNGN